MVACRHHSVMARHGRAAGNRAIPHDAWSEALDGLRVGVVDIVHDKRLGRHADARQLTRELPTYLRLRR